LNESSKEEYLQLISGEGQDFFDRAESLVLVALNCYVEQIANGGAYRWRLFTEDTNNGFEFINLFRMKYDVVLMNPPFGVATPEVFNNLKKSFPETWTELYACFVSRGIELIDSYGKVGAITSRAFLTINRLEAFREKRLFKKIDTLLDLGGNVMDAALVESCAYTISKTPYFKNIFVINSRSFFERESLSLLINNRDFECRNPRKYIREWDKLSLIPKHKLLYELDEDFLLLLSSKQVFEPNIGTIRQGMGTFSDFRFVHLAWEVPNINVGFGNIWEPLAKGGPFSLFYGDIHLMLNWSKNGSELCEINKQNNGQTAQVRQASDWWRISGCTYSKRSAKGFSARALPSNCIVTGKGPAIVTLSEITNQYILGWLNSRLITSIIALQANAFEFNTGILKQLPWKQPSNSQHKEITELSTKCVSYSHFLRCFNETDPFFYGCPYVTSLNSSYQDFSKTFIEIQSRIDQNSEIVSRTIDSIYEIDSSFVQISDLADNLDDIDLEENEDEQLSIHQYVHFYISWFFGVLFGRWDGNRVVNRPDFEDGMRFFGPIPVCSPGMLQNSHGLPASQMEMSKDYPFRISWKGIFTDDEGNTEDILRRTQEAFHIFWKDRTETIEQEACQILGIRSLREYFRKPTLFFADHLKRYSKSRRAAPIYWPLSTPSGSYTIWLYYHRVNDQTIYTCVNDYVDPKLKQVTDEAARLRLKKSRSSADEKELERLTDFERELKDFREELLRVAKFWEPNLNDGVEITAAPLWKLFQHKPWQKRLKETWQKLEAGEYDWAHLAYSIWPDRVREKCKTDKSLAIAHDLETLYVEPPAGSKKAKKKTKMDTEMDELFEDG